VAAPSPAGAVGNLEDRTDMIQLEVGGVYRNTYTITCK
jgi:hypothetical protein